MTETARLRLRPPRPDDAPALAALMTPAVSQWLASWPVPFTRELAHARIAGVLDAMAQGDTLCCVIEHAGETAGWIGAARLPGTARASFGYWLGEPHHGQALMREAAPAFVAALRPPPPPGARRHRGHLPARQPRQRPHPRRLRPEARRPPHRPGPSPQSQRVGRCLGTRLDTRSTRLKS